MSGAPFTAFPTNFRPVVVQKAQSLDSLPQKHSGLAKNHPFQVIPGLIRRRQFLNLLREAGKPSSDF